MRMQRVTDLSHHLSPDREPRRLHLKPTQTLETSFMNEFEVEMNAHIGTHVEGPFHCLADGKTIDAVPPDRFVGEAAVVDLTTKNATNRTITEHDLSVAGSHIKDGDIVLLKTGYDDEFPVEDVQSEEYMAQSPYLTPQAVEWLIKKKIKLLGIDFWSIEPFPIDSREGEKGHIALFMHEIPLIHSLVNLIQLASDRVFFVALPLPIKGLDSSPVRAVAIEM
ncbi:MAG: cyclase family protein [Candidatus Bathyarchaeota archaeon]|nr:MAG: cyclase family protein [Candidatus Bathyarchaeota archaeon]